MLVFIFSMRYPLYLFYSIFCLSIFFLCITKCSKTSTRHLSKILFQNFCANLVCVLLVFFFRILPQSYHQFIIFLYPQKDRLPLVCAQKVFTTFTPFLCRKIQSFTVNSNVQSTKCSNSNPNFTIFPLMLKSFHLNLIKSTRQKSLCGKVKQSHVASLNGKNTLSSIFCCVVMSYNFRSAPDVIQL